jgi:hypothetical protein
MAMRETLQSMSQDAIVSAEMNTVETDSVVDKQRRLEELQRQKELIEKERLEKVQDVVLEAVRMYLENNAAAFLLSRDLAASELETKAVDIMHKRLAKEAKKPKEARGEGEEPVIEPAQVAVPEKVCALCLWVSEELFVVFVGARFF